MLLKQKDLFSTGISSNLCWTQGVFKLPDYEIVFVKTGRKGIQRHRDFESVVWICSSCEGRSASGFNDQASMFVKVKKEMPANSPVTLTMWAESSCVVACSPHYSATWFQPQVPKICSNSLRGRRARRWACKRLIRLCHTRQLIFAFVSWAVYTNLG